MDKETLKATPLKLQKLKNFILYIAFLTSTLTVYGQTDADNCGFLAANQWTVNTSCVNTAFDFPNSYNNNWSTPLSCASNANDDGWCWFAATSINTILTFNPSNNDDARIHVFDCGAAGVLGCPVNGVTAATWCSNVGGDNANETINMVTVIGNYYAVRVQEGPGNGISNGNLCVYSPIAAGDEPCTAGVLPVNAAGTCTMATVNDVGATNSVGIPAPGCDNYTGGDVWLTITVPASGNVVLDTDVGGLTTVGMAVYSAASCAGPFTLVECDASDGGNDANMPLLALTGQTPGATLYIRLWDDGANASNNFRICATNNTAPANNEPCSATALAVDATCTMSASTVAYATNSSQSVGIPASTCGAGAGFEQDVWFTSTVPASGMVEFALDNGGVSDSQMEIYSGPNCNTLTSAGCFDDGSTYGATMSVGAFVGAPGTLLWIRVWEKFGDATGTFSICAREQTYLCDSDPLLLNDFCSNPATLIWDPSGTFAAATAATFTADNPVNMDGNGNPTGFGCGSLHNNSWYQFTATDFSATAGGGYNPNNSSDTFSFTTLANCSDPNNGIQAHIYDVTNDVNGCCTAFSSVSNCEGNIVYADIPLDLIATGLIAGNTYVLMIDGWSGNNCDFVIDGWFGSGILPVELVELQGIALPDKNGVMWKTASELNNDYFNVLRSYDGLTFEKIGEVKGAGISNQLLSYQFSDYELRTGVVYYQLEQVDFDGAKTPSEVISINRKATNAGLIRVYPNPTEQIFTAELNVFSPEGASIVITSLNGVVVEEKTVATSGFYKLTFDLNAVESGLYFINYTDKDSNTQLKLVKK